MGLTLVSFALCPSLCRARALLIEKNIAHEVRLIELSARPAWFGPLSPRGRVPLLVTTAGPIDDPRAILEYLEETEGPPLWPRDPYLRAQDRGLFSYAEDEIFPSAYRLQIAPDEDRARAALAAVLEKLAPLERRLEGRAYLSGDGSAFGLADIGLLPFALRAGLIRSHGFIDITRELPNLAAWNARVLARPSASGSVPEDFGARMIADMERRGAWLVQQGSDGG
ncbi:MAG: glutathione S-transferase family protein [Myxococcota bacterium]